ncbi:MAG: 30S ribosomal protein S17 [Planctomycetes bacterium]|nr:30S ribosomal protein S17 [Planctomycetota bacterium]
MEANAKASESPRNTRRVLMGTVMSDGMDKTVSVRVERRFQHPKYNKYIKRHVKYLVHDEENTCRVGDTVEIAECRPLSKNKRWRLVKVTERAVDDGGDVTNDVGGGA